MTKDEFLQWLTKAKRGERIVYGPEMLSLGRQETDGGELREAVFREAVRGNVWLFQRVVPGNPRRFDYIAIRGNVPFYGRPLPILVNGIA